MREKSRNIRLMNGLGATAPVYGGAIDVSDYRHVCLQVSSSGSAAGTLQFAISQSEIQPDFTKAASPSNPWTYVQCKDLANASTKDGAVGLIFTVDTLYNVEVNTNLIKWLCPVLTAYTQGKFFVEMVAANDSLQ